MPGPRGTQAANCNADVELVHHHPDAEVRADAGESCSAGTSPLEARYSDEQTAEQAAGR
jgi:hypothetical protein